MSVTRFEAFATTRDVEPGDESADASGVHVRGRVFTDVVEASDPRIRGVNRVVVDVDVDPATGRGELRGRFTLRPDWSAGARAGAGAEAEAEAGVGRGEVGDGVEDAAWQGELVGEIVGGLVSARGLARGEGALAGAVLRVDFRQVPSHAGAPPVAEPKAYFEMSGLVCEDGGPSRRD
jgi:hypothetical protein